MINYLLFCGGAYFLALTIINLKFWYATLVEKNDDWFHDWVVMGAELYNPHIRGVNISWIVELRDIWIGFYWKRYPNAIDLYITLVPCLPINVYYQWMPQ